MFSKQEDSFDYRRGYLDGQKDSECKFCKNLLELIENGFINSTEEVIEMCKKSLRETKAIL